MGTIVGLPSTQDEKAYAGLAHAWMMSTRWIGPLIIGRIRKESKFVSFHALQALFWQILFTVVYMGGMAIWFGVIFSAMLAIPRGKNPPQFPAGFFFAFPIVWIVCMGCGVIALVLGILFCLKAMRGEWADYPAIGRWARRAAGVGHG